MLVTSLSFLDQLRRDGASEQWQRLVDLYTPFLRSWLHRYEELSHADVDDLTQEVLFVVAQELPNFEHNQQEGAFRPWLRQILVNRLREFWRNRQRRPQAVGGSDFLKKLAQLEDDGSGISAQWDREHNLQVAQQLLAQTKERFAAHTWEAFRLQVIDNRSAEEVATKLDIPPQFCLCGEIARTARLAKSRGNSLLIFSRISDPSVRNRRYLPFSKWPRF